MKLNKITSFGSGSFHDVTIKTTPKGMIINNLKLKIKQ